MICEHNYGTFFFLFSHFFVVVVLFFETWSQLCNTGCLGSHYIEQQVDLELRIYLPLSLLLGLKMERSSGLPPKVPLVKVCSLSCSYIVFPKSVVASLIVSPFLNSNIRTPMLV